MAKIDMLSTAEALALAHFIEGCFRVRGSAHWRTAFYECARRDQFRPYASLDDAQLLRALVEQRGSLIVCQVKTAQVLGAAAADGDEPS